MVNSRGSGIVEIHRPDHQVDALRRPGVAAENIHVDHAGGTKASRPELDLVLKRLRGGDVLVITRLDRLGRSVRALDHAWRRSS
ncbi:recombinase family protein [Rhodococcus jostii]|uniref:recombinase family protein n=1 Tax=Rhodococcus jostii TaxID=132919 RepID=UPI001F072B78|nr:recombinase family protein [Rhodococcus jostii]